MEPNIIISFFRLGDDVVGDYRLNFVLLPSRFGKAQSRLSVALGVPIPVIDDVEHHVAGQCAIPCLDAAQGIHLVSGGG